MYDTKIGRWMAEDPIEFKGGDANLYRAMGNDPTNITDPSGLEAVKIHVRNADEKGYEKFSPDAVEFYPLAMDTIISGQPDKKVRKQSNMEICYQPDSKITFYDAMVAYCKKEYGDGWEPVPLRFVLTDLKFSKIETDKVGVGFVHEPRIKTLPIPALLDDDKVEYKNVDGVHLAHFHMDGFWVFKCVNEKAKRESFEIGIRLDFKVHTWNHTPYDKEFADELAKYKKELKDKDKNIVAIGRPYDQEGATGVDAPSLKTIGNLEKFLVVDPEYTGKDLKKIIYLKDLYPGIKYSLSDYQDQ
jgi:hypothetical protein